jgi:hypothetical protein
MDALDYLLQCSLYSYGGNYRGPRSQIYLGYRWWLMFCDQSWKVPQAIPLLAANVHRRTHKKKAGYVRQNPVIEAGL